MLLEVTLLWKEVSELLLHEATFSSFFFLYIKVYLFRLHKLTGVRCRAGTVAEANHIHGNVSLPAAHCAPYDDLNKASKAVGYSSFEEARTPDSPRMALMAFSLKIYV